MSSEVMTTPVSDGVAGADDPAMLAATKVKNKALSRLFLAIFFVQIAINFDSGAVPAMLDQIKQDLSLEPWEMGMMGGVQYIGLVLMSPLSGLLLQKYSSKVVLSLALWLNLVCVLVLATGQNKWLLMASRLGIGITQTTPCVYAPVWVDEFALEGYATTWMSVLQAGVPLGVMVGYATGGGAVSAGAPWQTAIWVQVAILAPLALGTLFVPARYLDINGNATQKPEAGAAGDEEQAELGVGGVSGVGGADQEGMVDLATLAMGARAIDGAAMLPTIPASPDGSLVEEPDGWSAASAASSGRAHSESISSVYSDSSDNGRSRGESRGSLGSMDGSGGGTPRGGGGGGGGGGSSSSSRRRRVRRSLIPNPEAARGRDRLASLCGMDYETEQMIKANSALKGAGEGMPIEQYAVIAAKRAQFGLLRQLRGLMRSRMWVATVAGLCALYFVVTGVQFWATEYLTVVLGESLATVIGAFTATSATGPVLGVVFGGWYVDRAGGYKDAEGRATASKCCAMFGAIAVCLAVPAAFVKHFESVIAMVWLVLFWGGAVVPGATGLLLTAVPHDQRQFSSAMAMLATNVAGYAAGTILPGAVMEAAQAGYMTDDGLSKEAAYKKALELGFGMVLCWSVFAFVFIGWSALVARRELAAANAEKAAASGEGGGGDAPLEKPFAVTITPAPLSLDVMPPPPPPPAAASSSGVLVVGTDTTGTVV
jgi:MFS family permease